MVPKGIVILWLVIAGPLDFAWLGSSSLLSLTDSAICSPVVLPIGLETVASQGLLLLRLPPRFLVAKPGCRSF